MPFPDRLRRLSLPQMLIGLYLLVTAGWLIRFLLAAKRPAETKWDDRIAAGKVPGFLDYMDVGLWWGGLFHLAVIGGLALSAPWWIRWSSGSPLKVRIGRPCDNNSVPSLKRFWICLGLIAMAALPARISRMDDSFWGDEAWAVERYSHGYFVAAGDDGVQGDLKFKPSTWEQTFFDDRGGGSNHQLQTISGRIIDNAWRKFRDLPQHEILEWPYRILPVLTGVGAILMIGFLLRRFGFPLAGLAAAAILAAHPWHIRYSCEARGYAPMLFFLLATIWALAGALRHGRWRDWLLVVVLELLAAYSWKGAPVPLLGLNLTVAIGVLLAARRAPGGFRAARSTLSRMVVLNAIIAGIFINLYWPSHLQIGHFWERSTMLKGAVGDLTWFAEYLDFLAVGADLHDRHTLLPVPFSIQSAWGGSAVLATIMGLACLLVVLAGLIHGMRRSAFATFLFIAPTLAVGIGIAHFWFNLEMGLFTYYVFYGFTGVILLAGLGVEGIAYWVSRLSKARPPARSRLPIMVGVALVGTYAVLVFPLSRMISDRGLEPLRDAFEVTRGQHEELGYSGKSKVRTIYQWRHARIYDPRANLHARDAATIRGIMAEARAVGDELYVVVGNISHVTSAQPDVMALVKDTSEFEPVAEFWTLHPVSSLLAYRMLTKPLP